VRRHAQPSAVPATVIALAGGGFDSPGDEMGIELELPDHGEPLACPARIVRGDIELTAVEFTSLTDEDADRLGRFVFSVQRLLAGGELEAS